MTIMAKAGHPIRTLKRPLPYLVIVYHAVNDVAKLKSGTPSSDQGGNGATIAELKQ